MKKILILTASYGDGHNAAAKAVRDAIAVLEPGAKAQVVDLFEIVHPTLNVWMKRGYQMVVRYAPGLWSGVYSFFDRPKLFQRQMRGLRKLREGLAELLERERPEVVVSTYPVYAHLVNQLFSARPARRTSKLQHPSSREAPNSKLQTNGGLLFPDVSDKGEEPCLTTGRKRDFQLITIITDSISVCSAWYLAESDLFIVANEATAMVLERAGVAKQKVRALGFPVSPLFARERPAVKEARRVAARPRVLYAINTGKAVTGRALSRLLALNHVELTISTGRNEGLRGRLTRELREYGHRVRILGWTNEMPRLLMSHDLLISKAGGAMVQEAIAARCPMIINQVIPGQEEGNARLIESLGAGAVVDGEKDAADLVQEAFADSGRLWQEWRENLERVSRPDAALRIGELILQGCRNDEGNSEFEIRNPKQTRNSKLKAIAVG